MSTAILVPRRLPATDFVVAERMLRSLHPGGLFEIRIPAAKLNNRNGFIVPEPDFPGSTISGLFDDVQAAVDALLADRGASVFVGVNRIKPELRARRNYGKLLKIGKGEGISDDQILTISNIFPDFDSIRETGISATNRERDGAINLRDEFLADHHNIRIC